MKNMTLVDFVNQVASNSPVPGGGSIAAVCGTLSAALTEMVANLTLGKKKYIQVEEDMKAIIQQASKLRNKLLDDIQRDSDSYNMVITSYKMSKDTDEDKLIRQKSIQKSLKNAALIPLDVAKSSYKLFPLVEQVIEKGNSSAVTDGLVAAMMARTSVLAALLNVKINLISIEDSEFVNNIKEKIKELEIKTLEYEKKILEKSPF